MSQFTYEFDERLQSHLDRTQPNGVGVDQLGLVCHFAQFARSYSLRENTLITRGARALALSVVPQRL